MELIRKELERGVVDALIDGLEAILVDRYRESFERFLSDCNADRWFVASDYSMGRTDFRHDAMAFALIPYIDEMFPPEKINQKLPKDFKDCRGKEIELSYIEYLRKAPFFGFVFVLDRTQMMFADAAIAEKAVQYSIGMMKSWPNAAEPQNAELIRKAELCLSESKTNSFVRKVNEITILTSLGAFVALSASRKKKVDGMVWAPDRDNMTGVWEGLSRLQFHANFHSALHRRQMPEEYKSAIAEGSSSGPLWFDPYVRLADFLATPAASMYAPRDEEQTGFEKCNQIVREVLADNPRVAVHCLSFSTANDIVTTKCEYLPIAKRPRNDQTPQSMESPG